MLLIFVFDPLAVCMVIAANMSLMRYWGKDDEGKEIPKVLKIFAEKQEKDEKNRRKVTCDITGDVPNMLTAPESLLHPRNNVCRD